MAHVEQFEFFKKVKEAHPDFFKSKTVLEIGSQDVNGSIRSYFDNCKFLGLDISSAKCVDLVIPGELCQFPTASFDVIVSTECFEHTPEWKEILENSIRQLRPSGLLILTFAHPGRAAHGTIDSEVGSSPFTGNYYKNLSPCHLLQEYPKLNEFFDRFEFIVDSISCDTYFLGFRGSKGYEEKCSTEVLEEKLARARGQLHQASQRFLKEKSISESLRQRLEECEMLNNELKNKIDSISLDVVHGSSYGGRRSRKWFSFGRER